MPNLKSHEFWIEPEKYILQNNLIDAHLKVGQKFNGMSLMYNKSDFTTFKILSGQKNKKINVKGIIGDIPALSINSTLKDLLIIYHETTDKFVNYKKFAKFEKFVSEKGYDHLIDEHIKNKLPSENFIESYRRYAKSLVAIKGNKGNDKKTGLLFEFVLNQNPYQLSENFISANLYYKKKPIQNQQVTIFSRKNNSDLKISKINTDEKGYIEFIVEEGREYLLDSVIIFSKDGNPKKREPIWHSIWASTTFIIPKSSL